MGDNRNSRTCISCSEKYDGDEDVCWACQQRLREEASQVISLDPEIKFPSNAKRIKELEERVEQLEDLMDRVTGMLVLD